MLYAGRRNGRLVEVRAGDRPLPTRRDVFNHSDRLEWGHVGGACAQLSLALLLHHTDETTALTYHQDFKQDVISRLPLEGWTLTGSEIDAWLRERTGQEAS